MAVTIDGTSDEQNHEARVTCACGKNGVASYSKDGLFPPDGWMVGLFVSDARGTSELVPACSRPCLHLVMDGRAARERAELEKQKTGIRFEGINKHT